MRHPLVQWLSRANAELSSWAAGTSWWRLIVFFVVVLIAAQLIAEQLHLKHETIQVTAPAGKDGGVRITRVGPDGVRITRRRSEDNRADATPPDASPPSARPPSAAPGQPEESADPMVPPIPQVRIPGQADDDEDRDEEAPPTITRTRWTPGGAIADLGATLIIVLFTYLAAAKIVVRKVRQADEKVRTAEDAAGREAMERQLVQARLQVLQAQVEPHFLFNTLAAVDYLIETDPARASQMQKALITYLRGALPQMREESSTLGREMRLIRSYLELIKMRIEDRLEVQYEVPPELDGAEFPPMMLQSLVENAIKHGLECKPEGGKLTVRADVEDNKLRVTVADDGVGFGVMPSNGTGLGLSNIRERLKLLHGEAGQFHVAANEPSGVIATIEIPYKVAAKA